MRRGWLCTTAAVKTRPRVWPSITRKSVATGNPDLRASHGRSWSKPHWSMLTSRCLPPLLWRAGLRIGEAMALTEPDFDPGRGSVLVPAAPRRRGAGAWTWNLPDRRAVVGLAYHV